MLMVDTIIQQKDHPPLQNNGMPAYDFAEKKYRIIQTGFIYDDFQETPRIV